MRTTMLFILGLLAFIVGTAAFAVSGTDLGAVAGNVSKSMSNLARLITGASYVAGLAFATAGVVKFKAHKENPTQIPISTPIALVFVGAALVFLPSVVKTTESTLFVSGIAGGPSGLSDITKSQN